MLSTLAEDIYMNLRERVPQPRHKNPTVTYSVLVAQLRVKGHDLADGRDPRLATALGDLVRLCRTKGWPAISALVVRADTGEPGSGYYDVAHPDEADPDKLRILWANELDAVKTTVYPINRSQT